MNPLNSKFEFLTMRDLREMQWEILRPPTNTRPAIRRVSNGELRAVVKDFSTLSPVYRNTAGRFLVWREAKAYRRLRGIRGIPEFYRVIEGLALVIQEIPGVNIENLGKDAALGESFFRDLESLLTEVHEKGVAHCDLKRAANTLVGEDGRPYIIDWAAAILDSEFKWYPLNLVFRRFLLDDLFAVIKIKLRHIPEKVDPAEMARYNRRSQGEKLIRSVRDRLRALLQKIV